MNFKKLSLLGFSALAFAFGAQNASASELEGDVDLGMTPFNHTSIRCESFDHRYNSCFVGHDVDRVMIEQQLSRAGCVQGFSWGHDYSRGLVWVDKGCRAVFRVYRRVEPRVVECNSLDFRYASCYVGPGVQRVELARQLSRSACTQGFSWGTTWDSIWVDRGCRAQFRVYQ